jgi:hypothetical protein
LQRCGGAIDGGLCKPRASVCCIRRGVQPVVRGRGNNRAARRCQRRIRGGVVRVRDGLCGVGGAASGDWVG